MTKSSKGRIVSSQAPAAQGVCVRRNLKWVLCDCPAGAEEVVPEAIRALPEPQRAVVRSVLDGSSHREIAGPMGTSTARVGQLARDAFSTLRAVMVALYDLDGSGLLRRHVVAGRRIAEQIRQEPEAGKEEPS